MKKTLKIISMVPLFVLCSCGNETNSSETNVLSETDAKAQVVSMKAEVEKEDFKTPTSGQMLTELATSSASFSFSMTSDIRFNTNVGSRYYYSNSNMLGTTIVCYYEKDGKYYGYVSSIYGEEKTELTEDEFTSSFDSFITESGLDAKSLKANVVEGLDDVTNLYDNFENTSTSVDFTTDVEVTFTKINESSFKVEANGKIKQSSAEAGDAIIKFEYENYLPKSRFYDVTITESGKEVKTKTTQTYTWGSVDYIYPEASK